MKLHPKTILLSWFVVSLLAAFGWALQQANRINRIEELILRWTPDQHLYVKGDLGIDDQRYADLEQWLDENAPHWTIVLLQSAADEQYQAPDGRYYTGMDAVEYALGHGLANRTGFGQLEHPQTGETDGAVFVLFLQERKFSYYASEAQDRRGLGESKWIGDLDQPAFRAMRGGGRILDAVKDTVTSIDTRLQRSIEAEAEAEARAERERERALGELRVDLQRTREAVASVATKAAELKAAFPAAEGPMTTPPVETWNARLTAIDEEVNDQNVRTSAQQLSELMTEVDRHLNGYAQFESFAARQSAILAEAEPLGSELEGVAAGDVAEVRQQLKTAAAAHDNGDPAFVDSLRSAEQTLDTARQKVEAERQRRARAAARRRLIWNTALVTMALTLLASIALLYWLNRRRAPARQKAIQALREREKVVRVEMDRVLALFERAREILGPKEKIANRGYAGDTKELCDSTFQKIDDLLIMSNEVDRVMDEAEELIQPRDVVAKVQNQFSATRFERGMNRISGEPLTFHEDQGIPAILRAGETDENGRPLEQVSLTFEQVFSAFRQRSEEVGKTLNLIEASLLEVNDGLGKLEQRIQEASEIDKQLATATEQDGFFHVPNFFEVLLPSAEADHDKADEIAASDPVQVVQQYIPRGLRKIEEGIQLASTLKQARETTFPQFNQHAPRLKELGYETNWIQEEVAQLGAHANELFALAAERSIASEAAELAQAVTEIGVRVGQCADLAEGLHQTAVPSLDALQGHIQAARQRIAQTLGLAVEQTLHDEQADPDSRLAAGHAQLAAARAALQRGGFKAAQAATDSLQSEVQTGQEIVDYALQVLDNFRDSLHLARERHATAQNGISPANDLVTRTRETFAESALRLQACDPAYPDAQATLTSHLRDAEHDFGEAWQLLEQAEQVFHAGKLLEADGRLQVANATIENGEHLLADIRGHVERLEAKVRANVATIADLNQRTGQLESQLQDPRTTRPTLAAYDELLKRIEHAGREIVEARVARDPFQNAEQLAGLATQVSKIEGLMTADREAHAEASRAVHGAVQQLSTALQYVDQARRDGIPDSELTVRCVREIQRLERELDAVQARLNDRHEDWQSVDEQAARLNAELGTQAARLKGELERAQQSVETFQQASREVFEATRWTGRYGMRVKGSPGSDDLERARRALNGGDYELMIQLSRAAAMAARFAVEQAEREVLRRQREEARRAEAARRAEMARRQRSIPNISFGPPRGGGGGFGGFGGGGGSFGGGGGGGGGGSGFSRSGW